MMNVTSYTYAQTLLTPECYVEIESDKYVVYFTLPNYTLENDDGYDYEAEVNFGALDPCGTYTEIVMEDADHDVIDVAGYPELPFFSLNLLLPDCASNVSVNMVSSTTYNDYPSYYISPARKGSIVNAAGGLTQLDIGCYNTEYYTYGYTSDYPMGFYNNYYAVSDLYSTFNSNGVTFSIFPFSYHPNLGYITVLQEAVFVIEFDCGDLIETIDDVLDDGSVNSIASQVYFDTFNGMQFTYNTGQNGDLLIIASHRNMETSLMPFVYYKQSQNYDVEVEYLDDYNGILGNPFGIKQFIYSNYTMPHPDFVLLIGNLTDIPPFIGTNDGDNPYSDDSYHPLLGRWIIGETQDALGAYADLRNIISKTIQSENYQGYPSNNAALFSGTDTDSRVNKKLYRNIKQIARVSFDLLGMPDTLYDGRIYGNNLSQAWNAMMSEFQNNPRFFVYRGHGYNYNLLTGIADPYCFYPSAINAVGNLAPASLGFGFACALNSYETNYSFGARWVAEPNGGGPAYYGSTTNSYRSSNNYFSRRIFKCLSLCTISLENFPLSLWLRIGELNYFWALPTFSRFIEVRKYNLIGDPTFAVYGMNDGYFNNAHAPKKYYEDSNTNEGLQVEKLEIYDLSGKLVLTAHAPLSKNLPLRTQGIYVAKIFMENGIIKTKKIIK